MGPFLVLSATSFGSSRALLMPLANQSHPEIDGAALLAIQNVPGMRDMDSFFRRVRFGWFRPTELKQVFGGRSEVGFGHVRRRWHRSEFGSFPTG